MKKTSSKSALRSRVNIKLLCCITLLLCLALFTSACGSGDDKDTDKAKGASTSSNFEIVDIALTTADVELFTTAPGILNQASLYITGIEDGTFYGLGYGPSGDGSKWKHAFSFDSLGSVKTPDTLPSQSMISAFSTWEIPKGSNVYYYFEQFEGADQPVFKRMDFNTFTDEVLCAVPPQIGNLEQAKFTVSDDMLYYFSPGDESVYSYSMTSGKSILLYGKASGLMDIFLKDNNLILILSDSITSLNQNTGEFEQLQGTVIGREDDIVYFVDVGGYWSMLSLEDNSVLTSELQDTNYDVSDTQLLARLHNGVYFHEKHDGKKSTLYAYSLKTDKASKVATGKVDGDEAFYLPNPLGKWALVTSTYDKTMYIWDTKADKLVGSAKLEGTPLNNKTYGDQMQLFLSGESQLVAVDGIAKTIYRIDTSALNDAYGSNFDALMTDGTYFYIHDISDDWSTATVTADRFYRFPAPVAKEEAE